MDDCLRLLREQTGILWGKPILRGWIKRSDGVLLRRRHTMVRNSFETVADVKLQPGGQGTQVLVTLRTNTFVAAFITLWLGFAVLFCIYVFATGGVRPELGLVLLFPAFGFGLQALGRALALSDRAALLRFVGEVSGGRLTP